MTNTALRYGDRSLGRCLNCKHTMAYDAGTGGRPTKCASCGSNSLKWQWVSGRVTSTKCGSRCTSAVGPSCDCECGGHNHGISFLGVSA